MSKKLKILPFLRYYGFEALELAALRLLCVEIAGRGLKQNIPGIES